MLTIFQVERLSRYEEYFHTAIHQDWARYPGKATLQEMNEIMAEAGHTTRLRNFACSVCVLTFLKEVGGAYYIAKEQILEEKNRREAIKATIEDSHKITSL